jgi:hypothetical protein
MSTKEQSRIVVRASTNLLQCYFYIREDLGDADGAVFTRGNLRTNKSYTKLSPVAKEILPSLLLLSGVASILVDRYHFVIQKTETYSFEKLAPQAVGILLSLLSESEHGEIMTDDHVDYRHFKPELLAAHLSAAVSEMEIARIMGKNQGEKNAV